MKRIDLLIERIENIYELFKTHFETPCSCTVPITKSCEHVGNESLIDIVQVLKNIEQQVHISNELTIDFHNSNAEAGQPKELKEVLRRQQVIDILKISERTYYRHIKNGILVPRQIGNRNFFYHSDLIEALEYSRIHGYL